jgi:phosphohistidine phosphatase
MAGPGQGPVGLQHELHGFAKAVYRARVELLVIRHAAAVERAAGATAAEDRARRLTPRGRRRFERVVRALSELDLRCDRVLHSPWTRAMQTAAMLEPIVAGDFAEACRESDNLARAPGAALLAELAALGEERVAVVGHEPWLGELVALLILGSTAGGTAFRFRKGGVARLEGEPTRRGMALHAFLPPRVLDLR